MRLDCDVVPGQFSDGGMFPGEGGGGAGWGCLHSLRDIVGPEV